MTTLLNNKIDFIVTFDIDYANPNGDPIADNMPRTTFDGYGLVSDVALKRKLRNRLQDMFADDDDNEQYQIFIQSTDRANDGIQSLETRFSKAFGKDTLKSLTLPELNEKINQQWLDVRSFGQVFTNKITTKEGSGKLPQSVRGAVSISPATSTEPIEITSMQITTSTNREEKEGKKDSSTMGMKQFIEHATYVFQGTISPTIAEKTGFTEEDAELIKQALVTLFENDQSAARPSGSMAIRNVYWFTHNNKIGNVSTSRIRRLLSYDANTNEFELNENKLDAYKNKGLKLDIIEGF